MKLIRARFPATCPVCKNRIVEGNRVYWASGQKAVHEACFKPEAQKVIPPATAGKYSPDFTIDWSELRPLIAAATSPDKTPLQGWKNPSARNRFRSDLQGSGFGGFTGGQMHRWVTKGYETEAIKGLQGLTPPLREKRRTFFCEDGDEMHVDRALSGEENFMSRQTKRVVIPGVRLNIELDASAGSSKMLFDYQRWIAQTIYALESSGVDCEVNIFTLSRNLFGGQYGTCRQMVRVKTFGKIADFAGFSAMFSPGAFRGIMFSLFALHADRQGLTLRSYGSGVTTAWGVEWNSATRSINVACNWTATEFPVSDMTAKFRAALEEMRKAV